MKPMVLIPLAVAGCVGIAALIATGLGARFSPMDPVMAAAITSISGVAGIFPILRTRQKDAVAIVQLGLIGTVLHVLCTAIFAVALAATHVVKLHGPFVFWLMGAYWVSLAILVWQLRRVLLVMTAGPSPKVQNR